jgi:hypothetical protein
LFDAIFITLGNIVKHALSNVNSSIINATTINNTLVIVVKNQLTVETDPAELKERLGKDYCGYDRTALRREGRSGFHKMHNILRNSFTHEDTDFKYEVEDNKYFVVTIKLNIEELLK